jgi:hypothetical protein
VDQLIAGGEDIIKMCFVETYFIVFWNKISAFRLTHLGAPLGYINFMRE